MSNDNGNGASFEPSLETPLDEPVRRPLPEQEPKEELDRVREIILGPDASRQRLRGAEVDRLREILFGAQIEEYERRFTDLRRELERVGVDLRQGHERLVDTDKQTARRIELIEANLRKLTDDFHREQERGRSRDALLQQLATQVRQHEELLVGIGESVLEMRKALASHDLEIRTTKDDLMTQRDQQEQRTQTVRRELRQTEDTLRAELRRLVDRLEHQKTDRKALASMLVEVATRLETGNTVTGLLEGLAGPKD